MGFFLIPNRAPLATGITKTNVAMLHRAECSACPLNNIHGVTTPKMPPHGTERPLIYVLGEAPGKDEDAKGRPFVGPSGKRLRSRFPKGFDFEQVRWGNVIRTRPPKNRTPTPIEVECCRPSVERDIAATKPVAIFGFGNVPLQWALGMTGIQKWRGRHIPVTIGGHTCWFFPMLHPSYVLRMDRFEPRVGEYGSEFDFVLGLDLRNAIERLETLPDPLPHTREQALEGIETFDGLGSGPSIDAIESFLAEASDAPFVGFDYETNGKRPYANGTKILSVAIATKERAVTIALHHPGASWSKRELEIVEEMIVDFIYDAPCRKVSHGLMFEMEWTAYFYGAEALRASKWEDTISQAYVLDERAKMGKPDAHSLEFLCMQRFGLNLKAISALDRANLEKTDVNLVLRYNALDAKYHRALYIEQAADLKAEGLTAVYQQHRERVPTVVLSQLKGIPVDQKVVAKFYKNLIADLEEIEADIAEDPAALKFQRRFGHKYNPGSSHDVANYTRKVLGQAVDNVNIKSIGEIKSRLLKLTLEWRKVSKQLSTYVKPVREGDEDSQLWPDGMLHQVIELSRVRTTRTSSDGPNMQNWPKRKNKELRSQIKPRHKKQRVVSFDLGGIQARNIAMESKDPALIQAFWDRYDIHADWTERIEKRAPGWLPREAAKDKDVFKFWRNKAKNEFVFPSFFGAQPKSLAKYLGIALEHATKLHADFAGLFPGLPTWHKRLYKMYATHGYVSGLSGYRRHAPMSPNEKVNSPIQADETLMVLDAMTRLSKIDHDRLQATLEIHDDLTFIWNDTEIDELAPIVIDAMINYSFEWINVPILVEMSVGPDWASQEDVGKFETDTWNKRMLGHADAGALGGSWQDGTGWANSKGMEKAK